MSIIRANKFQGLDAPNPAIELPADGTVILASGFSGDLESKGTFTASGLIVENNGTIQGNGTVQGSLTIDGTTTVAVGASGTPAITASGDPNTGLFFPAADTTSFSQGGTERFRFGSAGQFGIGGATYGTTGHVLTSQGASSAPIWAAAGLGDPVTHSMSSVTTVDKDIPSGTKRITVVFYGVSTSSGSGQIEVRLGTSSSFIDSGYKSAGVYINAGNGIFTRTSGWQIWNADASISWSGTVTITNTDASSLWAANWTGNYDNATVYAGGGTVNISSVTRIRFVVTGVGNFDGGTIGLYFE
jgi:hypothetical protein